MRALRYTPKRSLRTILIGWFVLFSIVPLAFLAVYSIRKFESAIDHELSLRLSGNAREISSIFNDYKQTLQQRRDRYVKDPNLLYHLSINESSVIRNLLASWMGSDISTRISFYSREGKLLVSASKVDSGEINTHIPVSDKIVLNEQYRNQLKDKEDLSLIDFPGGQKISLILFSRINSSTGRLAGYIEQMIDIDRPFLNRLKAKMRLEIMMIREGGQVIAGTSSELLEIKQPFITSIIENDRDLFFDYSIKANPFGFILYQIEWGRSKIYLGLGASKFEAGEVLKNVNLAFLTVVLALAVLILFTGLFATNWILRPIYELVNRLQGFESSDTFVELPVTNETEIGLLTRSFNEISKKIIQARADLKKKIKELEGTNQELKDTQAKLVHSAKMVSLGQLVAGVAHELNNPISFIYSNMVHLRDYSQKLIQFAHEAVESNPNLKKRANDFEIDYIEKDMPKLITSCEEGARRTKEIVLGLRNFSRLEEAKLKEVDIREALDNNLNLLQGEIKNRIQVHRQYEPVPNVLCYASQINQVLMNILSNAVQAIEGPGQVWISTTPIKSSSEKGGRVQISIQDSGKGMAPEVLEKIFDPFFTTKSVGQGTGLGLSISYGIIQNHGGEIQVRSEVGVGTEFIVIIPVEPPFNKRVDV